MLISNLPLIQYSYDLLLYEYSLINDCYFMDLYYDYLSFNLVMYYYYNLNLV
jgi:hypothetical protein